MPPAEKSFLSASIQARTKPVPAATEVSGMEHSEASFATKQNVSAVRGELSLPMGVTPETTVDGPPSSSKAMRTPSAPAGDESKAVIVSVPPAGVVLISGTTWRVLPAASAGVTASRVSTPPTREETTAAATSRRDRSCLIVLLPFCCDRGCAGHG